MTRTASVFLLFVLLSIPVAAQDSVKDRLRFKLWTDCAPLLLVVEELPPDAADIGVTHQSVETLVRSKLRAAQIYSLEGGNPYLHVNVSVKGGDHSIVFEIGKNVTDANYSLLSGYATTWKRENAGSHGENAELLRQSISEYTDMFVDEYLRVNADSCK
jgi:hypothetical protein